MFVDFSSNTYGTTSNLDLIMYSYKISQFNTIFPCVLQVSAFFKPPFIRDLAEVFSPKIDTFFDRIAMI